MCNIISQAPEFVKRLWVMMLKILEFSIKSNVVKFREMLKQFGRHIPRPIVPKSYAILYPNICVPFRKTSDTNLILSEVKNFIKDVLLAKVIYSAKSDSSDIPYPPE